MTRRHRHITPFFVIARHSGRSARGSDRRASGVRYGRGHRLAGRDVASLKPQTNSCGFVHNLQLSSPRSEYSDPNVVADQVFLAVASRAG